jgi:hypothetical protein
MNDAAQSALRAVLKYLAGFFIAKGLTDESTAETVIASLGVVITFVWGIFHRKAPAVNSRLVIALLLPVLALASGCAASKQYATTTSTNPTNGVVTVTVARSTVFACGDAKAVIDKVRASAGKTSSVGASGISEESTTTGVTTNAAGAFMYLLTH